MKAGLVNRCVMAAWIVTSYSAAAGDGGGEAAQRIAAADQHEQRGEYRAAEKILLDLLRETDRSREGDLLRAVVLNNLGSVYHYLDQDSKAESCYRRSIELHERILGAGDQSTIRAYLNLALLYIETGQASRAEGLGLKTLMGRQDAIPGNEGDRAMLLAVIGAVRKSQGNFAEAERYCFETVAIWDRVEPNGAENMKALNNPGAVYAESGRNVEALASYKRALVIGERSMGPEHPGMITLLANTGAAHYFALGPEEAEPYYRRALNIGEKTLGPHHSLVGKTMLYYASVLEQINRKAQAKVFRQRAKAILSATESTAPGRHTVEFNSLVEGSLNRR